MESFPAEFRSQAALSGRLLELWELTGDQRLQRLAGRLRPTAELDDGPLGEQEYADWISTTLMDCFHRGGDPKVFALLFELNQPSFLATIQAKLRRSTNCVDAHDVLQEVFLNIYRYPNRFLVERPDSFRSWGHRIVRNALLKQLKASSRDARVASIDLEDSGSQWEDPRARTPAHVAEDAESAVRVNHAFLLYLNLYLAQFERLTAKEKHALTLVEIDGATYKQAAAALGLRLENLKMVIFRGRRKIFRGLATVLADLGAPAELADVPATIVAEQRPRTARTGASRPLPISLPAAARSLPQRTASSPKSSPHVARRSAVPPAQTPLPAHSASDVATEV